MSIRQWVVVIDDNAIVWYLCLGDNVFNEE